MSAEIYSASHWENFINVLISRCKHKGNNDILTPSSVPHLRKVYMQVSAGNGFLCLSLFCVLPTFGQNNCTFPNWQLAWGLCHSQRISCLSYKLFSMLRPSAANCNWDKLQIKRSYIYRTLSTKIFNYILEKISILFCSFIVSLSGFLTSTSLVIWCRFDYKFEKEWRKINVLKKNIYTDFFTSLNSMQFVAMQTPRDMNGLDACALHCANPVVT